VGGVGSLSAAVFVVVGGVLLVSIVCGRRSWH